MNDIFSSYKKYLKYLITAAIAVLAIIHIDKVLAAVSAGIKVLHPLFLGCIIAYILNIIMNRLEKIYFPKSTKKAVLSTRRSVCIVLSILLVFILVGLVCALIIPEIANIIAVLSETIPIYWEKICGFVLPYLSQYEADFPVIGEYIQNFLSNNTVDWQALIKNILNFATNGVGGFLTSTFSVIGAVAGGIVNFVIGLIFAVYILFNKEKLGMQFRNICKSYLNPVTHRRISYFLDTANRTFSSFIIGQCTEAVILGLLCTIGMAILRLPYASTIGTLIGATALIPIVGAYIGAVLGALMIIVVDPIKALWFIIFLVILQQVEGNVIYPKVVGSSVGLPGLWVLAAVTVGGGLGGILGMLIGVPIAATIYKLIGSDVKRRMSMQEKTAEESENDSVSDELVKAEEKSSIAPSTAAASEEREQTAKEPAANNNKNVSSQHRKRSKKK
ncbi:MAG: AI-2E family transporter [Oscillospiraceae bacterium]